MSSDSPPSKASLSEIASYFLRLGLTAFGGPAAHIAMMHQQVVKQHKWMDEQQFLDLVGMANLIPGPTSTETAIYIAYRLAGWIGLVLGGVCFILPAMLIVLGLAWAYARFGTTGYAAWLFYGTKPVVIAIILQALWGLGKKAVKGPLTVLAGLAALGAYLLGVNVILVLFAGGLVVMLGENLRRLRSIKASAVLPLAGLSLPAAIAIPFSLPLLFFTFLKIGAVLYGSGYVLLAFLRADFVIRLGWLSDRQLVDAITIGQVTPGPVFTTATFIGYLLGGLPGALLATLGIFLPSFFYVAISTPILPRIRNSPWTAAALDGVNVAALGLMAGVTLQLAQTAFVDTLTVGIALVSAFLLFRYQTNSTWLIAGGAAVGVLHAVLRF
jgi:chromate transporter